MITRHQISGLILTGGQGRRLQNRTGPVLEKGLVALHGQPLVARMQGYMAPDVSDVFISANRHLDTYADYGIVVADDPALGDCQGPLAGIASVLPHVLTPWVFVMPVDIPYPPAGLLQALLEQAKDGAARIYYVTTDRNHPLCMLMHAGVGPDLRIYMGGGGRRVQDWQGKQGAVPVIYQARPGNFHNINTPEDLHAAQQLRASLA